MALPRNKPVERPNTLGLADRPLEALLTHLDASGEKGSARRQYSRWPFRQATILTSISHPGGSSVTLRLACRNISCGGIGLLHTSYVHPGSRCTVDLPTAAGGVDRLVGTVQRCSHRRGILHELGIKFNTPVDLAKYLRPQEWTPSYEHVDQERLAGTLLVAEPSEGELEAFKSLISETSLRVRHVKNGAELLAQPLTDVSVIVAALVLPDMTGTDVLTKLRANGVKLPVVMLSNNPSPEGVQVREPNAVVLPRPIEGPMLLRVLAEWTLCEQAPAKEAKRQGSPAKADEKSEAGEKAKDAKPEAHGKEGPHAKDDDKHAKADAGPIKDAKQRAAA